VTNRTRIMFTAGAGLRTFATNPFKTWIALSKATLQNGGWPICSRHLNRLSLHAGYIHYILFKADVVKKPKNGETKSSVCNTCSS